MIRAISFDAAGTLCHLAEPVGHGYARVAAPFGIHLDPDATTAAFRTAWDALPSPDYQNGPAHDGDRSWWRLLVDSILDQTSSPFEKSPTASLRSSFFDALYDHYATPAAWKLFPEVIPTLDRLSTLPARSKIRLAVLSNFDPRLRKILAGHRIDHHFDHWIISSEVGAYKPDSAIFAETCIRVGLPPSAILHVGDDPIADIRGARESGLHTLHIDRPTTTLESIFDHPNFPT